MRWIKKQAPLWWALSGAIATVWLTFSTIIGDLGDRYYGPGDADQNIWFGWRFSQSFRDGTFFPTHFDGVVAPVGFDLLGIDGYLPVWVAGWVNLVASPIVAYNVVLVMICLANYWSLRLLVARVTARPALVALSAMLGAVAPSIVTRQTGHIQLFSVFVLALVVNEVYRVVDDPQHRVRPVVLGGLVALAYVTSFYFFAMAVGFIGLIIVLHVGIKADVVRRTAIAAGVAGVLIAPFVLTRVRLARAENLAITDAEEQLRSSFFDSSAQIFSADVLGFVTTSRSTLVSDSMPRLHELLNTGESLVLPGFAILIALAVLPWVDHRFRRSLVAVTVATVIMSLGPRLLLAGGHLKPFGDNGYLPYELVNNIWGLEALRAPGRFALALPIVGAMAFAIVAERWLERGRPLVQILAATLVTLVLVVVATPVNSAIGGLSSADLRAVAELGSNNDAVLMVPADCKGSEVRQLHLQIDMQQPMVGCAGQYLSLPWFSELHVYESSDGLAQLRCTPTELGWFIRRSAPEPANFVADVAAMRATFGVRFLVIEKPYLHQPGCETLAAQVDTYLPAELIIVDNVTYTVYDFGAG